ncbi:MAG: sodium:solute symporter family protein, partial [Chloroflexi bacterium]|nr:sodium:solute symporter family protein [Chloroflexota bacterium]
MIDLTIIVVYLVAVAVVGIVTRRKARGLDDFFVYGRKGSLFFITGSLVATIIGGSATVGMAGLGFSRGLTGAWWLLVGTIGLVFLGVFLAKKVRNYGLYTLPQLAGKQYDSRIALASSILIVVAWVGVVAGQIVAAGTILSALGMGSPLLWMIIATAVFIGYTVLGGQHAVIRTDVLQAFIIFAGIFTGLALVMSRVGGLNGLESLLPADRFAFPVSDNFGGLDFVKLLLLVGLTYVVGPDMYSRLFSAKDSKTAKSSALWTALILIPFALAITFIGMGASALLPGITPEQAFPAVLKEVLPPVASGLVLAALLCAVMSSADTTLLSASTILTV